MRVAGGHTITSQPSLTPFSMSASNLTSLSWGVSPFIFQFPATRAFGPAISASSRQRLSSNPTRSHGSRTAWAYLICTARGRFSPCRQSNLRTSTPHDGSPSPSAGSWIAKIFIASPEALSFGIWGIADVFRGGTSDVLASVGDKKITGEEYRRAFDRQVRVFSQQQGVQITPDQARAIGLDRQVLAQLLQEASLDAQAAKLGLAISDAMIAERITSNKAFQGPNGQFDANCSARSLPATA